MPIGYGLGAAIGLFSASVNPSSIPEFQGTKQQTAREVFREMRTATHSYGKNFALIGMVFSAVECTIESVNILNFDLLLNWDFDSNFWLFDSEPRQIRLEKWDLCRRRDRWHHWLESRRQSWNYWCGWLCRIFYSNRLLYETTVNAWKVIFS